MLLTHHSPIHDLLDRHGVEWQRAGAGVLPLHFVRPELERQHMATLGLCDLSALAKLGLKGRGAADWLRGAGVEPPANRYDTAALADGGMIARTDAHEFLLESAPGSPSVTRLHEQWHGAPSADPLLVERGDACFAITGVRGNDVLRQTCGVNFADARAAPLNRLVMTRVAGVSCAVLPTRQADLPCFRLWLDPSFAVSLWESLEEIVRDLSGNIIGAAALYPNLLDA